MLKVAGKVTITKDNITGHGFVFDKPYTHYAQMEMLLWAKQRIDETIEKNVAMQEKDKETK